MVCDRFPIDVVNIIDTVVDEIINQKFKRVLVFGTEFTLKSGIYSKALENRGITAIVPSNRDIETIGKLIYPNMENGIVILDDKRKLIELAEKYIAEYNADVLLLGCTELPLAIKFGDISLPILNTTQVHNDAIFKKSLC